MEGFASAVFKWRNHHGYEYEVSEHGDGCFAIRYKEDDKDAEIVFEFNSFDADGLIAAMQNTVAYWRKSQ